MVVQLAAVVTLAVVAALVVAGLALGAEELEQLGYHGQQPDNFRTVLGTKYHQSAQNFLSVVLSTFQLDCLFSFSFSFFFALLSSCFVHQ